MKLDVIKKESNILYQEIDECITELLNARISHDTEAEGKALFRMEGLMVGTLQHLSCIMETEDMPSNLDEAAEEYGNKEFPDEPALGQWGTGDYEPPVDNEYPREVAKDAFIAGVEWMTGQGASFNTKVGWIDGPTILDWPDDILDKFEMGDEVIVQIRKKDKD